MREQVLAMSSATIDRLLAPIRKASGGNNWRRPPRAYSGVRRRVPVRTFKGSHQIVLTRSRAYQSNDQAWVEQKNGMLVRRVVGYQRLEGLEAAQVLGELYGALRLFTNLFQPSFKLKSSERDGGRIKRQHHPPRTPLQRLIKSGALPQEQAEALRDQQRRTDPVALLGTVRRCQGQLAVLASGEHGSQEQAAKTARDLAVENRSLEVFLGGLQTLWHSSQLRRRKPKPRTGKRSRLDPFEPDVVMLEQWMEAEPLIRAKSLLERLIQHNPQRYGECHLRTLQRRLRGYRLQRIEREMEEMLEAQPRAQAEAEPEEEAVLPDVNEYE